MSQTPSSSIALEAVLPSEGEDAMANIIDWDGPNDAAAPINWSRSKRWAHIIIVAILGLVPNMATTMVAPGLDGVLADFHVTSSAVSTFAVTIFLLGLALGPMFLSCMGEVFGRLPVYHTANIIFIAFIIGNALTSNGWRWTFWLLAILGGAIEAATLIVMRETSPKILLERKAARLRVSTGNAQIRSKLAQKLTLQQVLAQALVRPTILLIRSPVVLVLSLYASLVFGVIYLLFTTFNGVFRGQYGFSAPISGLVYLGLGIALVLGVGIFGSLNPQIQAARMKADGVDKPKPEYRLLLMIWLSPCVALGLFIYGWTVYYKVHWIVPIIGTFFIGLGAYFVLMPTQPYLIELFGSKGAPSALSAMNVLRYMGGTFLPLTGPRLYRALGYGWGNSLLGFLALLFALPPVLFYKYGERLRAKGHVVL
nr:hypothetical protein FAC7G5_08 [Penicillium fuscum]